MVSRIDGRETVAISNAASAIRSIDQPTASREYASRTTKQEARPSRVRNSGMSITHS